MTLIHAWLSSIALQAGDSTMEGLACTYMGSNMASLMGSETVILANASPRTLSARWTFSIVHSSNCCRVPRTFVRYWDMRSSLAPYSFCICPTMS